MWADGVVWHASSALLSLLWLKKCSCSGWCWEEGKGEHSTVHYAILSTPSLHPSTFPSLICSPFPILMSPSFLLPPLSSHARCIFGSEWQFCTAPHCSTAKKWWQAPPPPLLACCNSLLFHNFNPRRRIQICSHADVYVNDGWDLTAIQQSFIGNITSSLAWLCNYTCWLRPTGVCNYLIMQDSMWYICWAGDVFQRRTRQWLM